MIVTAYKCFWIDKRDGKIWSTNKFNNNSNLHQEYFLDKINYPRFKFPILAFNSEEYAFDFGRLFSIAEVSGESTGKLINKILDVDRGLGYFWESHPEYPISRVAKKANYMFAPSGTIGLKSLKFVKWIKE